MRYLTIIALCLMLANTNQAQEKQDKFSNRFDDVFAEEEENKLTLRFFNALTGEAIPKATVTIDDGEDLASDKEGKVRFPVPEEDGFLKVHFTATNYITTDIQAEVIAGTLFFNRISVSPKLDLKDVRMVLDWEKSPKDIDAHFIKNNGYHISYRHTRILADGSGELDRDDMDGYGPETITVRDIDDLATYEFQVHDYTNRNTSNSTGLSKSKATVKVYGEGRLLYVFQIPQGARGANWSVFKISEGQFIETNRMVN